METWLDAWYHKNKNPFYLDDCFTKTVQKVAAQKIKLPSSNLIIIKNALFKCEEGRSWAQI